MREINRIVVHHSGGPNDQTPENIRRFHVDTRGWADIGYHFLITHDGRVHRGRDWRNVGAHAQGHNADSIGVCVIGDNTRPGYDWRPVQKDALRVLLDTLHAMWPDAEIVGHKDLRDTLCPGVEVSELYEVP